MINKLILDTLTPLNIPVSFQVYDGNANTYITFFKYLEQGESYADNLEKSVGHYIQVDIWSNTDYTTLAASVLSYMIAAGFRRTTSNDLFEENIGIYHKVIRFFYLENAN